MAIYRKDADKRTRGGKTPNASGLGRGFENLTGDNTPAEKKPLVVRRGAMEEKKPLVKQRSQPPISPAAGVGGRVVIRTDALPQKPLRSAKSARAGTTVLVRTERSDPPKKYRPNEPISTKERYDIRPGKPIVIDPRKKK